MGENIYLIGARAAGKSTMGRQLARALGTEFVDCDLDLSRLYRQTVAEMLEAGGWELFRKRESDFLAELARGSRQVIATGGGIVLEEANRRLMRDSGLVLYLRVPAELLVARMTAEPQPERRPSLTGRSPLEEVAEILAARESLYQAAAHQVIDGIGTRDEVLERLLTQCQAWRFMIRLYK